jgi:hypothetical protein
MPGDWLPQVTAVWIGGAVLVAMEWMVCRLAIAFFP